MNTKAGERKVIRKLQPPAQAVMKLMLEHADGNGHVSVARLDAVAPGWDSKLPSRNWATSAIERLRRSGRFAYEKARLNGTPVQPMAPEQPLTREQIEDEIAKSARKMARRDLIEMLREVSFCPRCGNNLSRLFSSGHVTGNNGD